MKRNKGLRDIMLDKIEDAECLDLFGMAVGFIIILVIIAVTIMLVFDSYEIHRCIDTVIQQYPNAPVEELKQRIELCNV